jgi:hypothetical protein
MLQYLAKVLQRHALVLAVENIMSTRSDKNPMLTQVYVSRM